MTIELEPILRADFSLDEDQQAVDDMFGSFFERESPPERVREAETATPPGFDAQLWKQLGEMRVVAMAVPAASGGDGAGHVELALLAEKWGRHLGPAPLAEPIVAARLLARLADSNPGAATALGRALDGELFTLALQPAGRGPLLVPNGAVADAIVAVHGDDLIVCRPDPAPAAVPNQGYTPLAWVDPLSHGPEVVASGPEVATAATAARRDWQLIMAAALTGMADGAQAIAVQHAKDRIAFGVPIGSFQAVAHPLVDVAMNVETSRRLVRKAAWWADEDDASHRELIPMAYHHAEHTAVHGTTVAVHTLGGVGFTVESDVQLYFRRAKGWTLVAGDPQLALDDIADALYGVTS
jgi:alkylation response protein AidB-like acyl-CoA dehydrogenase